MEMVQNTKDTEQRIENIAEVLGIDKGYITYNEKEQVYLISTLQELEKLEIKKEVNFSQLLNYPLKFIKCHFLQSLLVYEKEFKENLIFDNVVFSKSINFSRNTFYREVGFFGCEFENKLYLTQCVFQDKVRVFGVNLLSIDCRDSIFRNEVCFGRGINDPNLEKGFHFGSCSFKDGIFLNCQFHDNAYFKNNEFHWASFQNARFYSNAYFTDSIFQDSVDFSQCEFEKIANFYGVTFEKTPSFFQTLFKGNINLINASLKFDFKNLKTTIEQKYNIYNENKKLKPGTIITKYRKKPLDNFANDFRDSFRIFKNALIKDNNLLDASKFHKCELYCKELELDSKETKTLKDKVEKWQLWFYRKLCDHHTDLVLNLKWLVYTIALYVLLLGKIPFVYPVAIFVFCVYVYMCSFKNIWLVVSSAIVFITILDTPKIILGISNLFGENLNLWQNFITTLYVIAIGLVLFSLQKTARKNSIVPN